MGIPVPIDVEKTGDYTITYMAEDSEHNWNYNCSGTISYLVKHVKIVDSLKPVIALKLNDQVIHQGDSGDQSKVNAAITHDNPAKDHFMEEQETSSYPVSFVGAMAAAVSGLALLGYAATRRNDVA